MLERRKENADVSETQFEPTELIIHTLPLISAQTNFILMNYYNILSILYTSRKYTHLCLNIEMLGVT